MGTDILLDCWHLKRRGRPCPGRADLDPQQFAALMPWIYLVDVEDGGRVFRFRLIGRRLALCMGDDYLGLPVADIEHPGTRIFIMERCRAVCRTGEPNHQRGWFLGADGRHGILESVALPLASNGREIDQVLGAMVHRPVDRLTIGPDAGRQ